jgi:hypothetical protein
LRTLTIALLILYAIIGLTARLEADDYCVAALLSSGETHKTALDYTVSMYQGWNGRYTQLFVHGILARFEPLNNMLMPAVMIGLLVLLTRQPLFIAVWLMALPDIDGTLYWQSAAMTYLLPVILALLAWRLSKRSAWWAFPLALIAGGCSESMALLLIPVSMAAALYDPALRKAAAVWCAGLVIAFAIVYAAPGNAVRAAYFPEPSLYAAQYALSSWLITDLPALLFRSLPGLLAAYLMGRTMPVRVTVRTVQGVGLLAVVLTLATVGMVVYATSGSVPERVLVLPSLLWSVALWLTGSYHARKRTDKRNTMRLLNGLLILAIVWMMYRGIDRARYAAAWDARDSAIRAGQVVSVIDARDTLQEAWVLDCAAGWYDGEIEVMR